MTFNVYVKEEKTAVVKVEGKECEVDEFGTLRVLDGYKRVAALFANGYWLYVTWLWDSKDD